ncbi:hypothetical protein J4443_01750 [Candidatus Woesearchaeota archaeon]|nr:hypothetical protein [Candidatus Woesearchaeota archaeon]
MESKIKIANQVFSEIDKELSKKYRGKIVAIDIDTKDYFIGDSALDAYKKAEKKYPNKQFVFKRIGFRIAYFAGAV